MSINQLFISYSRADKEYIKHLVDDLRNYGFSVWFDDHIQVGSHWDKTLEREIKNADALVWVQSKTSVASDNVENELDWAQRQGKKIVPIRIEACETGMRWSRQQFIDFTGDYEQGLKRLVSDLRANAPSAVQPTVTHKKGVKPPRKGNKRPIYYGIAVVAVLLILWISGAFTGTSTEYDGEFEEDSSSIETEDPWATATRYNSVNSYYEYLENYSDEISDEDYDQAAQALTDLLTEVGWVEYINYNQEFLIEPAVFNENEVLDIEDFGVAVVNQAIFEGPMINEQSAVLTEDVLVKDQVIEVLELVEGAHGIWMKIAYRH